MKVFTIYASNLAAVAGLHKYKDFEQAILDQWYVSDKSGCKIAIEKYATITADELVLHDEQRTSYEQKIQEAVSAPTSKDLQKVLNTVHDITVRDQVRSDANKARGILNEDTILQNIEKKYSTKITDRNDKLFIKFIEWNENQLIPKDVRVKVIGRIDGWCRDTNEITEVKNRASRFFTSVPLYERVQVQVYLWMTDAPRCRFVQSLDGNLRETIIDRDLGFLNNSIFPELAGSIALHCMLIDGDKDEQRALLSKKKLPEKFVQESCRTNT
jgi:succinate dehydrogenase flavin-adding protein (antitoxin of CptAB toxin-antitoxin module)